MDLENKLQELRLELREGRFKDSVQHTEEKAKMSQGMQEEVERLRQVVEDERSRARRVVDDGEALVRREVRVQMEQREAEWRGEWEELWWRQKRGRGGGEGSEGSKWGLSGLW